MTEFVIPVSTDELIRSKTCNQYKVSQLIDYSSIGNHINVYVSKLRERGPCVINKIFDYPFSVIYYWNKVDVKIRDKTWMALIESCQKLTPFIASVENLNDIALSGDDQSLYRNSLKMTVYLICQFITLYENQMQNANILVDKCKGKKKKAPIGVTNTDWPTEVYDAIGSLYQLVGKCSIEKLWSPPVVDDDFVNLVANCCYKILENPEHCRAVKTRNIVIDILIKLNRFHNHTNTCSVKLVQLLQGFAHFTSCLQIICTKFLENNLNLTVREILREICAYTPADLEHNNQAATSFGAFLTEFGSINTNEVIHVLPDLSQKLHEEPYNLRNAVLTIMGEVIIKIYHKDATKRDNLLDAIEEHLVENNAFVRAKTLTVLYNIVEKENIISIERKNNIMRQMVGESGSLFDSSSLARKNAIKIMTLFAQQNIAKGLTEIDLQDHLSEAQESVSEVEDRYKKIMDSEDINFISNQIAKIEKHDTDVIMEENKETEETPEESIEGKKKEMEKMLELKRGSLLLIKQSFEYTRHLSCAIDDMHYLLNSKVQSDVLEAIAFFKEARLAHLPNVEAGVRKMLLHICSKEEHVKVAVADAYRSLFLTSTDNEEDTDEHRTDADTIVEKLSSLIPSASNGEIMSLERLIVHFIERDELDKSVVKCLWDRIVSNNTRTSNTEKQFNNVTRLCAAMIFSMVTSVYRPYMKEYLNYFVDPNNQLDYNWLKNQNYRFICYLLRSIQNLAVFQNQQKNADSFRLPKDHYFFKMLLKLCVNSFCSRTKTNYLAMSLEIIKTIYLMSENPDSTAVLLIEQIAVKTFTIDDKENEPQHSLESRINDKQVDSLLLSRFIAISGHVAIKQFTHFEVYLLKELKRRNVMQESYQTQQKTKQKNKQSISNNNKSGDNLDEEMGLTGATADDTEAECIRKICELELISDSSKLLNKILKISIGLMSRKSFQGLEYLQSQVTLAVSKLLTVSNNECRNHIELLIKTAARSPSEPIRANLIIALGDLIRRFTTELEPYTPLLYSRLRDASPRVRKSALNVISHLVLNDMIRVKGQISEMTTCLVDFDNPRIIHLARVFFQELANKDKALYNVMPDIISRLSNTQTGVSEENFHQIMEFLMPFIQKKNQSENLFEKLCARFHSSHEERSWKDLSYCLSLLNFNDNMINGLQFNMSSFAGKLHVREVYDSLNQVLQNARKMAKPELLGTIDELSTKLNEMRDKGVEDEEAQMNAARVAHKRSMRCSGTSSQIRKSLQSKTPRPKRSTNVRIAKTAAPKAKSPPVRNDNLVDEPLFSSEEDLDTDNEDDDDDEQEARRNERNHPSSSKVNSKSVRSNRKRKNLIKETSNSSSSN